MKVHTMRAFGVTIKPMARGNLFIQKEKNMKEILQMIELMDSVYAIVKMGPFMKASGNWINIMVRVKRLGLVNFTFQYKTVQFLRVCT